MPSYSENFVDSNGVMIWTVKQGRGIPVLLCNGGPGCCDYLAPVAGMIDSIAQVVRFEQRGCGRSENKGPHNLKTCIEDLENIRKYYGIKQWIIGGHSWGSDLALAYAVEYPKRILGLIGISGGVIHKDSAWREQYHRLKEIEKNPHFDFPPNREINKKISDSWKQYVRHPQLLKKISQLKIPALYIYGSKDIRPNWPVQQLANLLPLGKFELIKNAEHYIWFTHTEELRKRLRNFVDSVHSV